MLARRPSRLLVALALIVASTTTALGLWLNRRFYHDDALITLRYVTNMLAGEGIVWNSGERVEGYTNFAHLLFIGLLGATGLDLMVASRLVNLLALLALAAFVWRYLAREARDEPQGLGLYALPAGLLIVCAWALLVWAMGGLEAPLFALFCSVGIWTFRRELGSGFASERGLLMSGVAFALAATTRMDAMLVVSVSAAALLLAVVRRRAPWRRLAAFLLPVGLIFGGYFLWRLSYYGALLPNTFYAKGGAPGALRLLTGTAYISVYLFAPPFPLLACLLALPFAVRRRALTSQDHYLGLVVVSYLGYVLLVGGDHMPGFRFIVPMIPSICLLLASVLAHGLGSRGALLLYALLIIGAPLQIFSPYLAVVYRDPAAYVGSIVGDYIAKAWPAGSTVALSTAGSVPYYAMQHRYIDMLGLNDPVIARREVNEIRLANQKLPGHLKGDGAYVLARQPDYIILGPAQGTPADQPWFLSDLELQESPEFHRRYYMVQVQLDVSAVPDHEAYPVTSSGKLLFTYYQRIEPVSAAGP